MLQVKQRKELQELEKDIKKIVGGEPYLLGRTERDKVYFRKSYEYRLYGKRIKNDYK